MRQLGVFIEDLSEFRLALDAGESKSIEDFFRQAKSRRDLRYPDSESKKTA